MTKSQADISDSEQTIEGQTCIENTLDFSMGQIIADPPERKKRRLPKNAQDTPEKSTKTDASATTEKPRKKTSKKAIAVEYTAEEQSDASPSTKIRRKSTKKHNTAESNAEEETGTTITKTTRKKSTKKATEETVEVTPKRTRGKSTKKATGDQSPENSQTEPTDTTVEAARAPKGTRIKSTRKAAADDPQPETTKDESSSEVEDVEPKAAHKKKRKSTRKAAAEDPQPETTKDESSPEAENVDPKETPKKKRKSTRKAAADDLQPKTTKDESNPEAESVDPKETHKKKRKSTRKAAAVDPQPETAKDGSSPEAENVDPKETPKKKRKSTRKTAADDPQPETAKDGSSPEAENVDPKETPKKKRKSTRKTAADDPQPETAKDGSSPEAENVDPKETPKKKRKSTRKTAADDPQPETAKDGSSLEAESVDPKETPKKKRKSTRKAAADDPQPKTTKDESNPEAESVDPKETHKKKRKSTRKAAAVDPQPETAKDGSSLEAENVDPKAILKKRHKSTKKTTIKMAEKHPPEDSQPSASITEVTDEVVSATVPKKVRRKPAKVATTEGSGDATDSSKPKRKSTRKSKAEKASENTKTLDTYFIQPKKLDVDENVHSGPEERELQSESNHLGHTNHALVPVDPVDLRSVDQQTTTPKPQQALDNQPLSKSNQKDDTPEQTPDSPAVDPLVIQQSVAAQNTNENSPSDLPEVDMEPNIAKARTNVVAAPPQRPPIPQKFSSPPIWVNKHSPSHISMVAGNRGAIDQLDAWLKNWHTNVSANGKATAKKRGRAIGDYKSALISGPPGIGKTTVAHLIAKSNGYSAIEYNASDVRSRKLIQDKISHMVDNRTMTEFYQAYASKEFDKKKVVLIMDEVDGMSTGDHGGAQELIALIRITKVPIICICNDIQSKKVQSLKNICLDTRFVNKFTVKETQSVVQMVMQIAERENFHISESTLRSVMRSSHNDIRNTINMLQVQNLLRDGLEYEEAQSIIDRQRKDREMNIFEIVNILFSDTTWERKTLEEIADLCYQEQHLAPEMVFENYLKFKPSKAETVKVEAHGEKVDTGLKLAAEAAESIADGDLMESMMYSSHRHMNDPLLPAARYMFGSVRPAALLHGKSPGYRLGFPVSLGKGSTAMKCAHQVTELRNNMRLTTYATRHEIRREYIPTLNDRISSTLMEKRYDDAIDIMDTYYLNRMSLDILNDFDLSLDPGNKPMMKVPASTKRAFTLKYNKLPHPIGMAPKDGTDIIKKKTSSLYATNYLGEELALDGLSDEDAEYHFDVV